MNILRIALLGSTALFASPALAFDGNAIQLASLTGDMVTATEGYPNSGENDVRIVPTAPTGNYVVMSPLTVGRSVATHHSPERRNSF